VTPEEAVEYIYGYTVAHDVSARDLQLKKNGGQWLLGKTLPGFCPLGEYFPQAQKHFLFDVEVKNNYFK